MTASSLLTSIGTALSLIPEFLIFIEICYAMIWIPRNLLSGRVSIQTFEFPSARKHLRIFYGVAEFSFALTAFTKIPASTQFAVFIFVTFLAVVYVVGKLLIYILAH